MKIIEIRTHSIKDKSDRLTAEGEELARRTGQRLNLRGYQRFISGPTERCIRTLIQFGVPRRRIEVDPRFDAMPQEAIAHYHEKGERINRVGDFFLIPELQSFLESLGREVLAAIQEIASGLPENGRALVVSHGGNIITAAHLVKKIDFENLERLPECGGIKFRIENGQITGYEMILP